MGVVYRALDPALNRYVAVKVMTQGIATDPELRDRFMREARAAGSLQHPNIITIYDFGEIEGYLYIAMEYVEGSDLSEVMSRKDPLPVAGKIDIIVDVLQALDYAHNRRVVHRDVKPGNIRVSVDGRAKLMDFGIARLEKSDLTKSGIMIGTPDYMAPEQVTGAEITPATDVFAVGVVLFEFLTGLRPFEGPTLHAVLYKVVHEQPPRLKVVAPSIPPSLQPILDQALAKDPALRYPTAGAMARELSGVRLALSGAKTIAIQSRVTPLRTLRVAEPRAARRRRRRLWLGGGGVLAVAAAAGFLVWSGRLPLLKHSDGGPKPGQVRQAPPPAPAGSGQPSAGRPAAEQPLPTAVAAAPVDTPAAAPAPVEDRKAEARRRAPARDEPTPSRRSRGVVPEAEASQPPGGPPAIPAPQLPAPAQVQPQAAPVQAAPAPQPAAPTPPAPRPAARADTAPAAPAPAPDPRPEIAQLVAAYAQAIESKNIGELRRAYPGLTASQQRVWQQFFRTVRGDVKAELSVARLDVSGNTAVVDVTGSYEYDAGAGTQREPVSFRATAAREGGAWRLKTVP
jgi:hypothetical protein